MSSLAGRLARLNRQLDKADQERIQEKAGGIELPDIVGNLLQAIDADRIEAKAREIEHVPDGAEPSPGACEKAQEQLVRDAAKVFNGELIELIDSIRRNKEQTIDHENLDTLLLAEWKGDAQENAEVIVRRISASIWKRIETRSKPSLYSTPNHTGAENSLTR